MHAYSTFLKHFFILLKTENSSGENYVNQGAGHEAQSSAHCTEEVGVHFW